MRITLLACNLLAVSAFTVMPNTCSVTRTAPLSVSAVDAGTEVPITVTGNNIELTPSLVNYVNEKMERPIGKLRSNGAIQNCEVHLTVNKNPKVKDAHRVEVTTTVKGTTIRSSEESPDMYASIDSVSDRLARKLRKYKERRLDGYHGGDGVEADTAAFLEAIDDSDITPQTDDELFVDPYAPEVTKIKSFNLGKPVSLQEAIFALDYIDHDFYVFRDAETNDVNVVYKRNAGGVGLIQPADED